ncbi:MAG: glutamate synthase large subunit [Fimbriimonadaceae bacterium]|nr:glutamate synthase large subunit [Fimbriimonadaceae bacterium]
MPGPCAPQGLYHPDFEHDACGIGFVVDIKGRRAHDVVTQGIGVLTRLEHRGASGCDPETGDGAGLLIQVPHELFAVSCGFSLPGPGAYGVGMVFLPQDDGQRGRCEELVVQTAGEEGLSLLGWRDVPVDETCCGRVARETMPVVRQVFLASEQGLSGDDLERRLYVARRRMENEAASLGTGDDFFIASLSSRTIVYKGLLLARQLGGFYRDLANPHLVSALCLVHQRFSTNTFPSWKLAHPYRYIAHNGEINTVRGNVSWMNARESLLSSEHFGDDVAKLLPIVQPGNSDSASFDNVLELLVLGGRSLPHAIAMMVPEPWAGDLHMSAKKRAFYEYHASLIEPWDGPAAVAFTDGRSIGATLDRNGLRPGRYVITTDGRLVMASETGVIDLPASKIVKKGRLQPGKLLLVDTEQGRLVNDREIKEDLASRRPYEDWLRAGQRTLGQIPEPPQVHGADLDNLLWRQRLFGYTQEDIKMVLTPMASLGEEPVGSMGNDIPLACLSDRPQLLFNYFRQLFAQVTNPPVDPLRESLVMSLISPIGREGNFLDETPDLCKSLRLAHPVLTNLDLEKLRAIDEPGLRAATLPMLFDPREGGAGLSAAVKRLCADAVARIEDGHTLLVLSDRGVDADHAPVPSLLALSAVHHHLVRAGKRTQVGLVVESGEPREVMHVALLIGYGASSVNPYLAIETLADLCQKPPLAGAVTFEKALANLIRAVNKGLLKVMSKMGVSTLQGYKGAQLFEAVGLAPSVIDEFFVGTPSRIGGIGLEVLAEEVLMRWKSAFVESASPLLDPGGYYACRVQGERHMVDHETITKLQHALLRKDYREYEKYSEVIDKQGTQLLSLRSTVEIAEGAHVPIDEVEPASAIVKRFATGAMSFGSISKEAHETLAVAMNRIGGRSNSGEGGEDPRRFEKDANGDWRRSAVKQVASGRFGVTAHYLVNAEELQIKVAQGAKPGEGGQLPGHKVDAVIAKVRHSVPGVGLVSPPPHHDIYSIEDLAQLIFDLKQANPEARVSVKLVSEVGVGTIAAGVVKAGADVVLISGDSGGTGASPVSSVRYAGMPWELGLAETQQTLLLNDLRSRVVLQTDGKLQTGRDVVVAALLGAEEFGFSTMPLVALGCVMMRKCHLNTCPVGIATQDPDLRRKFRGQPEDVINFFFFVAEQVRVLLSKMGYRSLDEIVGRADLLEQRPLEGHWKARHIDLRRLLHMPDVPDTVGRRFLGSVADTPLSRAVRAIDEAAAESVETGRPVRIYTPVANTDRSVGTRLSGQIAKRHGSAGLPDDTVRIRLEGSAGQSFGAFLARGVTMELTGDANDYVGKGLSGGRLIVHPPLDAGYSSDESVIVGNTALYGATSGEAFLSGTAGERFAVRNSGATAVVEGVGDHGCEYMTNGTVVVLGTTGRNFAAGMSGGIAYVLDERDDFVARRCNRATVDLEPVDDSDAVELRKLVERHFQLTNSEKAHRLLETWERALPKFVKVYPHEFKRVRGVGPKAVVTVRSAVSGPSPIATAMPFESEVTYHG